MADVKRICDLCKQDATPKKPWNGTATVNNRRGVSIGLFCQDCSGPVHLAVDESPRPYGKWTDATMNRLILERAQTIKDKKEGPRLSDMLWAYRTEVVEKDEFRKAMKKLKAVPDGVNGVGSFMQTNWENSDKIAVGRHSQDSQGDIFEIIHIDRW